MLNTEEASLSYLDKMTLWVLDNLQIQIRNIHFRFENSKQNYSYGLTLHELRGFSTDKHWNQHFIDRSGDLQRKTN